ncbi:NADH:flavin oxidoreductase/NADH oxidase [Chelativorans sp. Marseille-P2723]|uniref:NADH:flavin oxidoreductase/NADH oxidase n=1 Tax=Chelativorans sp. Marseille-P2723 TaxID=2709133 RepID=UPI00156FEA68|nr:NADH:flavin oxidoreductase/NADH oxidase [Chelativorans sp. Marseille-P2723]
MSLATNELSAETETFHLFEPFTVRGVTARNRVLISPMCQYSAEPDGKATDYHLVHLGKFAIGGAGIVMAEATAVSPEGRISPWDLGLWDDNQIEPLRGVSAFIRQRGSVPAIQLGHAGRKGATKKGGDGGTPLTEEDAARGFAPWPLISASEVAAEGWPTPRAMSQTDIAANVIQWAAAARRAVEAGFDIIEIHGAHGYLIHQFLSPASNFRTDEYGGSLQNRMRFAIEVAQAVRAEIPDDKPLFFRISALDGSGGGWTIEDSISLARELKRAGVDVVDCSSGGMTSLTPTRAIPRHWGFQIPFAEAVRRGAGIPTVAVGLIVDAGQAELVLRSGKADFIGIGREALADPHWALRASLELTGNYDKWPDEYRSWMVRRQTTIDALVGVDIEKIPLKGR